MSRHAHRRAQVYRQRSRALTEEAKHEFRDEGRRRYMLDLAATYQCVADEIGPISVAARAIDRAPQDAELKSRAYEDRAFGFGTL
jgi:hypothetical protein